MNDETQKTGPMLEPWRLAVVLGLVVLLFLFYAYRLFQLQVLEGPSYQAQAEENRTTRVSDQTQRGIISDRNGVVLARNVASYNITITPAYLPAVLPFAYNDPTDPIAGSVQDVYRRLSALIDVPFSAGAVNGELTEEAVRLFKPCETKLGIKEIVYIQDTTSPYEPVRIKCNVSQDVAMRVREATSDMPGVNVEVESVRDYPTGDLTADIIGFLGPVPANIPELGIYLEDYYREKGFVPGRDRVGYAGIENSMQDLLGGTNGERYVEVDVAGRELRNLTEPVKPVPGNNVRLTIDIRLQSAAQQALVGEMQYWNTYLGEQRMRSGVVIAINPKTGEILAMVSYPSYENNRFARGISGYYYNQLENDPAKPLLNKAISAEYPPGSVFKMPTAIGALNERVVSPEYTIDDPGTIYLEEKALPNAPAKERPYVCWSWKSGGHGEVDWLKGVSQSCDVYFYKIGGGYKDQVPNGGLGIWRLGEYARALGYGAPTGVELPGEQDGLIPDPDWKRVNQGESWTTGDTYIASMGQGLILATPLQVLTSAAILSNDGKYMQPTLVREILDSEGNIVKPFEPQLKWDITTDPVINQYDENNITTGEKKPVEKWVVQLAKQAMRMVVTEGTAQRPMTEPGVELEQDGILTGGKTGTAEYCDDVARSQGPPPLGRCSYGNWPTHSWYFGYAPYNDPEIAVVAFVYNGGEGASVAAPIVGKVIRAYYSLKDIDAKQGTQGK
jgi:penicillin-binding protein 2